MVHIELDEIRPEIAVYKRDDIGYPLKPVKIAITEARMFADHVDDDSAKFARLKIDAAELSGKIRKRATALESAQILWNKADSKTTVDERNWDDNQDEANEMHDGTLDIMDFFFDITGNRDYLARVEKIREGRGNADMVLDMVEMKEIISEYGAKMTEKVGYTEDEQNEFIYMVDLISPAFTGAKADKQAVNTARELRDVVDFHLEDLIKKTRKAVKIIWRGNREEQNKYRSQYKYNEYLRRKRKEMEKRDKPAENL